MNTQDALINPESPNLDHLDPVVQVIVRARHEQRVTQAGLAEMSGISRRSLHLIEKGGDCTLSTLRRLTTALGLELDARSVSAPTLEDVQRENEEAFRSQSPLHRFSRPRG